MNNHDKSYNTNESNNSDKSSTTKEITYVNSIMQNNHNSTDNVVPINIDIDNDNLQINDPNYQNDSDQAGK